MKQSRRAELRVEGLLNGLKMSKSLPEMYGTEFVDGMLAGVMLTGGRIKLSQLLRGKL